MNKQTVRQVAITLGSFVKFVILYLVLAEAIQAKQVKLVFVGDSITEGYGLSQKDAYPSLLEDKLKQAKIPVKVLNGGVSGASSASAESRVKWYLKVKPDWIVLQLGGNDGLRGQSLEETENNLAKAIELTRSKGVKVAILGIRIPTNYGQQYRKQFEEIFPKLSEKYQVPLLPQLLENVGGIPEMNLPDGIHPNKAGHRIIAKNVFEFFLPLLSKDS